MSYDYAGQVVTLDPLSREAHPTQYELCELHTELLTVPRGWRIVLGEDTPVRPRAMDVIDFAAFAASRAASA
jgi:Protein of unknown function (DUF3499)